MALEWEKLDMTSQTASAPVTYPSGRVVALNVPAEEYLARYAGDFCEWSRGTVIKMAPVSSAHDRLSAYFRLLLEAYFALKPIGQVRSAPFVMRLDTLQTMREPDLQVILHTNSGNLTDTAMIGPADICIEIVSDESIARDYGDKFEEYEKAGVAEYWIVDPLRQECRFLRRQAMGRFATILPDQSGHYRTPLLPGLELHVPTLWEEPLPDFFAIGQAVQAMLESAQ